MDTVPELMTYYHVFPEEVRKACCGACSKHA